jgi:hypothetical protein
METISQVETLQLETRQLEVEHSEITGTIVIGSEGSEMTELGDSELDVSGGGGHQSNSHFDRHKSKTNTTSFAGPEGAGSTFSHQEESVSSGNSDLSWD